MIARGMIKRLEVSALVARGALLAMTTLAIAGCGKYVIELPPSPVSKPAAADPDSLKAGFARVDITPPPGFGNFGYGPEGRRTVGYRNRLYARALVLEDKDGEVIAFALADLDVISTLLHRRVAAKVYAATDSTIGADRLILSATHTHSAPGHFLSAWPVNAFGSSVMGFDPELTDSLTAWIANAVIEAYNARRPAVAAWTVENVWRHTRNRGYPAYVLNASRPAFQIRAPPFALDDVHKSVNPRWAMLRVDTVVASGDYVPAGALSVFAIHGTGFPAANDLYDADIHGLVARGLERHIDSLVVGDLQGRSRSLGVHLFANGTEGDVSPSWPPESRCPPFRMKPGRRAGGPRTPLAKDDWQGPSEEQIATCLAAAKAYVKYVGHALADTAIRIFDDLKPRLRADISIARAFQTLLLTDELARQRLCERGQAGTSVAAGGPDGRSRFEGWELFGFIPLGLESGGHAVSESRSDCQRPKRTFLAPLQSKLVGSKQFPEQTQIAVVRVGNMLIGTVPGEVTTMAGLRMMAAMQAAIPDSTLSDSLAILGLANGDLRYITTAEEYWAQLYEGGSNLYGPETAGVLADQLRDLTASLFSDSATVIVGRMSIKPGKEYSFWPKEGARPDILRLETAACRGGTVVARWYDAPPGSMVPAHGLVLEFTRVRDELSVVDDDIDVEVRAIADKGPGYLWEARWTPPDGVMQGERFKLNFKRWPGSAENPYEFDC